MAPKAPAWLLCNLVLLAFGCQKSPPDLIVIRTSLGGIVRSETTPVRIERTNGRYLAENNKIVDDRVMAFLEALEARSEDLVNTREGLVNAPRETTVPFAGLGITQNWLDQNAEPAFDEYFQSRIRSVLPSQRDLFLNSFRDTSAIRKAVDADFQRHGGEGFSQAHVEIYYRASATAIVAESSEPHDFMIPWKISEDGRNRISFNANIGRTLAALLPDKAALKERLDGTYFRRSLAESLYMQMCPEWRKLEGKADLTFRASAAHRGALDPCDLPSAN